MPFDVDVHLIPQYVPTPALRYLFVAETEELVQSEESIALRWFSLEEAMQVCDEPSMQRQLQKLLHIKKVTT